MKQFKQSKKKNVIFITATILLCPLAIIAYNQQVITFISPRSQSFNAERMLAGKENIIHQPKDRYTSFSLCSFTSQASSSFRPERINQCFFGEDIIQCTPNNTEWNDFIVIAGSQTENRVPEKDWLADYFGLPTDFKSSIKFRPQVNNFIFDIDLYITLNSILSGLFVRIDLPFVYANWNLNIKENIQSIGEKNYLPGYFNAIGAERNQLSSTFSDFISGCSSPRIEGLTFHPLQYAKMALRSKQLIRFAELTTTLGYDYYIGDYHHIGIAIQSAAPCGNRPQGQFLFEPMIGNGHHWELGAEFSAHCRTWTSNDEERFTEFFFNATATHLFSSRQKRSFDLHGSPNNRYMLAEKLASPAANNLNGNGIKANANYVSEVTPIANLTTFDVKVGINAQADVAFMYSYTDRSNSWSVGYSIWKRGCETIQILNSDSLTPNTWAAKGDAYLFGFILEQTNTTDLPIGTAVALSATEKKASITTGTNSPITGATTTAQVQSAQRNPYIDSPQLAFAGNNQPLLIATENSTSTNQVYTSIQPHFISINDLDINSASTSGFSQKLFTHFNHKIELNNIKNPLYIGLGSEIEFGCQAGKTPVIGADKCINCALSQWTMWIKTGTTW